MSNVPPPPATLPDSGRRHFLLAALILLAGFALPLFQVVRFALQSDLYSFIVIVPFVSAYLVWIERSRFSPAGAPVNRLWGVALSVVGLSLVAGAMMIRHGGGKHAAVDSLACSLYAFVTLLGAAACWFLGRSTLKIIGFPLAFLVFLAPFPAAVEVGIETVLQHGSSWVAHRFFDLAGMPVFREGTYFQLPGFEMQVAPECSGIRSTLALFLTSLVAGRMFLRSPANRIILAAVVLPLALLRNGFRVFVIGELCVEIGPHMIHSWIHRQGGPLFFALSLIPFSLILYLLLRRDRRAKPSVS